MQCNTFKCDICRVEFGPILGGVTGIKVKKGREMDASGNGYNTIFDYKDVCISCAEMIIANHFELN